MAERDPATPPRPTPTGQRLGSDDDGLEGLDDFREERRRMSLRLRLFYVVLLALVAGMVCYLVLIIIYPEEFGSPSWIGKDADKERVEALRDDSRTGFMLGAIRIGMAPDQVLRLYPSLRLEPGAEGGLVGFYKHHGGDYQVWFRALEFGGRAYRIRSEHHYDKISYLEVLGELGERYGTPAASDCGAETQGAAIKCAIEWALPDTRVEAAIRTAVREGGGAVTTLAVTATDTRPPHRASVTGPATKEVH